jgi:hypothetical protein
MDEKWNIADRILPIIDDAFYSLTADTENTENDCGI